MEVNKIICGDALKILKKIPDNYIDSVITSPPYWALRDYGVAGQIGMEENYQEYLDALLNIFDEVRRVLKVGGTCWVNIGDTYSSSRWSNNIGTSGRRNRKMTPKIEKKINLPEKSLCQIPARFSIEMTARCWILRNEIIWHKPNAMPSSADDRFTVDFERVYFFTKSKDYFFEPQYEPLAQESGGAIKMQRAFVADEKKGRNKRCVWSINTKPYVGAHFATFPEALVEPMIKAGCPVGGIVLDPFMGAGTTAVVARKLGRQYLGIELNPKYIKIANNRLAQKILI